MRPRTKSLSATTKPKKFKLTGKTQGRIYTVEFIVDQTDAHIVRAHAWGLIKRNNGFQIRRNISPKVQVALAHDILGDIYGRRRIFHKNLDSLDFRRNNLMFEMGDGQTHCKFGHELTPDNLYVYKKVKQQQCLTCMRISSSKRYQERKAAKALA